MSDDDEFPPEAYEAVKRCRMALAEMGYGGANIRLGYNPHPRSQGWTLHLWRYEVPRPVIWMAYRVAKGSSPMSCWACWLRWRLSKTEEDRNRAFDCRDGNCTRGPDEHPYPPRELLVAGR